MMNTTETNPPATRGLVLRSHAGYYDIGAWLLMPGRRARYTQRLIELARLDRGERVLDVGCGTGTLALAARRRVGDAGWVCGIDASPEMIARAERKARRAGLDVTLQLAAVEALPFADASFDAVFSTLMLHHLPRPARAQCVAEIHRVLKPGGRVLAVDFNASAHQRKGWLARLHRHGHVEPDEVARVVGGAGLQVIDSGAVGFGDLHFTLATKAGAA